MKNILLSIAAVLLLLLSQPFALSSMVYADSVTITSTPSFYGTTNQLYSYKIVAKSDSNRTITYSFPSAPSWLSFTNSSTTLTGTPTVAGRYQINITASDGTGKESQNFWLYIQSPTPTATPTTVVTATPTPSIQPTTTLPVATATPTPTSTPTPTVTSTPATNGSNSSNMSMLSNLTPGNNARITDNSPIISGTIHTGYPLDRKNLNMFFNNNDITSNINLTTQKTSDGSYDNSFKYQTHNLSNGSYTVSMTITNPDGLIIPTNWSFTVNKPLNPVTQVSNAAKKVTSGLVIGIVVAALALLIFIIILVRLIRQKPTTTVVEE